MPEPGYRRMRATIVYPASGGFGSEFGIEFGRSSPREIAYITPRFPAGIKGSGLAAQTLAVQTDTMVVWFKANFDPSPEPHFGFAEAAVRGKESISSATGFSDGTGFSEAGTFYSGGTAQQQFNAEFSRMIAQEQITAVAKLFPGDWVWKPEPPDPSAISTFEIRDGILATLGDFEGNLRSLRPEHGGLRHNQGPEGPLDADEITTALRVAADVRLLLPSDAHAAQLSVMWLGIAGTIKKLGSWCVARMDEFGKAFAPAAGKSLGDKLPMLLGTAILVWQQYDTIGHLLLALAKTLLK